MRVEVRLMYSCGKALSKRVLSGSPAYRGKLSILENRLHVLNRVVTCARLTDTTHGMDTPLLPELIDVHILWLQDASMRVRGTEEIEGVLYAQTWDIKVL